MTFLSSFIKNSSDTLLACITAGLLGISILSWYVLSYRSHSQELTVFTQQNQRLIKRISSLKKRSAKAQDVHRHLSTLESACNDLAQELPSSPYEGYCKLLDHIKQSDLVLLQWKPGDTEVHQYSSQSTVHCKLTGSFDAVYSCMKSLNGATCTECTLSKSPQGLMLTGTFVVFSRRQS